MLIIIITILINISQIFRFRKILMNRNLRIVKYKRGMSVYGSRLVSEVFYFAEIKSTLIQLQPKIFSFKLNTNFATIFIN